MADLTAPVLPLRLLFELGMLHERLSGVADRLAALHDEFPADQGEFAAAVSSARAYALRAAAQLCEAGLPPRAVKPSS